MRRRPTHDPPLTTRACADWMGATTEYVRQAIDAGELEAECWYVGRGPRQRRVLRVHQDHFRAWLIRLGWSRVPPAR